MADDIQAQIAKLNAQVAELIAKRHSLNADLVTADLQATEHEEQAKRLRGTVRAKIREERNAIDAEINAASAALKHAEVIARTNESRDSAAKAQKDAEAAKAAALKSQDEQDAALARLTEKEKQLDELLAKASAPPEAKPEEAKE